MAEKQRLTVRHLTRYTYDNPVHYALQRFHLTPKDGKGQTVLEWQTSITGAAIQAEYDDHFQNRTHLAKVDQGVNEVQILSEGLVEVEDLAGVTGQHRGYAPLWLFRQQTAFTKPGSTIRDFVSEIQKSRRGTEDVELFHHISREILQVIKYKIGTTDSATTAEEAMKTGAGVCQDHAHVMISVSRALGFPARYISGYLLMDDRVDQDATHGWCEVYIEGLGWLGLDVSNGISPDARYITIANGRDYFDAAPTRGIRQGEGKEALEVALQVQQ